MTLGLVASIVRPGGNATGVNFFSHEFNANRLGLMHELLPKATRFVALVNPANAPKRDLRAMSSSITAMNDWR